MYCDGLHHRGTPATLGVLVANQYAPDIVTIMNTLSQGGYHTQLALQSWQQLTGDPTEPFGNNDNLIA